MLIDNGKTMQLGVHGLLLGISVAYLSQGYGNIGSRTCIRGAGLGL